MNTETDVVELEWRELMQRVHDQVGCTECHAIERTVRFWLLCGLVGPIAALIVGVVLGGLAF